MPVAPGRREVDGEGPLVDYETESLERGSYITAIVHLYRGEVARANSWRMRLDQTTNWAVFVTASALGFAFGSQEAAHFSLQFANLLLFILLWFEARRFRFFDVWRARVRMIEKNFFAPILRRDLQSPESDWALLVATDLAEPHFHVTRLQALRLRLVRNYLPIYGIMLVAWLIKLDIHPQPATSLHEFYQRMALGALPPWISLSIVASFYLLLLVVSFLGRARRRGRGPDNWDIVELVKEEAPL